jgi:membrane protease YdiL (CAAX protease family)
LNWHDGGSGCNGSQALQPDLGNKDVQRYINIGLFGVVLVLVLWLVETAFQTSNSGLSIYDTKGAGQITLLGTTVLLVTLFSKYVAKSAPFGFFVPYTANWKRALAGFGQFYLATTLIIIAGYLWFAAQGAVSFSDEGIANLSLKIAERTFIGLLVVVVLAFTEEMIFRVFLMRYLMWDASTLAAITAVISASLIFAFLHNLTDPLAWFTHEQFPLFIGLFILGALLCVTYISTGSITCAIGLHSGFLGSKVFLRKTQILSVNPDMLLLQNTADLRMSPIVWALWIVMGAVIYLLRHRLRSRFLIENDLSITQAHT